MPELPEVETIVRDLRPRLVGRRFVSVQAGKLRLRCRWNPEWGPRLVGRRIDAVERRGKWILLVLDQGFHLVMHLGMTGQLQIVSASEPRSRHTHLIWDLNSGREQLRFCDIRRFGGAALFADPQSVEAFLESKLGPEPFGLDPQYWQAQLGETRRCLKAVLLDQRVVAGVGNIYADESLFEARLHPALIGRDLEAVQAGRLRRAIMAVLRRAIDKRGSSIRNYVDGSGQKGEYQREFRVYGQAGNPCPRCRTRIERIRLAGRSTHFCPQCQKVASSQ